MSKRRFDFRAILQTLDRHHIDFIVVGGVSAVLNGAPISTFDLDLVHSRTNANVALLESALQELKAHYRFGPNRDRIDTRHPSRRHQAVLERDSAKWFVRSSAVERIGDILQKISFG